MPSEDSVLRDGASNGGQTGSGGLPVERHEDVTGNDTRCQRMAPRKCQCSDWDRRGISGASENWASSVSSR